MQSLSKRAMLLALDLSFIQFTRSAVVVTLGDSYASGNGIHELRKDYDDLYCFVERDTTPGGKYASTRGLQHIVTACSGDRVNETAAQWDDLQLRYSDEATELWKGSVIVISTGQNSARSTRDETFSQRLNRCLTSRRFHTDKANQIANYDEVQAEVEAFYTQLAVEAADATVRVTGYPKVFNSNQLICFIPGTSVREANFFDSLVMGLNHRIMKAIETVQANFPDFDIQYVNLVKYYTNGACSPFKSRQVRNINPLLRDSSFHPTQWGYDKAYGALLDTMIV